MGGPGSGRWPRKALGTHLGHSPSTKHTGRTARVVRRPPEPQPKANKNWHPVVKSWWNAWGTSDIADVAQQADWMLAWTAAELLDQMYTEGRFTASLLHEFRAITMTLHSPRFDLLDAEPEAEADDEDAEVKRATDELISSLTDEDDNIYPFVPRKENNGS